MLVGDGTRGIGRDEVLEDSPVAKGSTKPIGAIELGVLGELEHQLAVDSDSDVEHGNLDVHVIPDVKSEGHTRRHCGSGELRVLSGGSDVDRNCPRSDIN